ncbi:unnamed protein product [Prunus armeniaca]|uniref:Uncharacterized protein n=1 Tax=Prunus armeniaca TaxID=36596 RepID=A0A6J5TZU8_PRUAR|nr:unnamed protein product [Prunus armeniaca]CAB4299247.1 unnamed protein product [Prunus armeniaca]
MGKKRSRNKSSRRANPSSAQEGPLSSAQEDPHTGVSAACAKPVALQADRPSSAQEGSSSSAQTAAAYVASPSVANTTAAPAPAQRLYAERQCCLKEFLENCHQWVEEEFNRGCQNMLKILIVEIADLESKDITRGPLTGENIFVIGIEVENLKVLILNTPRECNPGMPCYREQFRTLVSEVVRAWEATRPLATKHFLKMIEYCIPQFYFKQLEWHPLLLSSEEQAELIIHAYIHLQIESKGWKEDYKKVIPRRNVDFRKTLGSAFGFSNVYKFRAVEYQPNPLGALMFYRNAHFHVNDHIYEHQKKNKVKPELIKDALLTTAQKENKLAHFFPEVPLELFNYMLIKGIDINAAI